jgi:hypothetical protein
MSFYTRQADELRRRGRQRADHAAYLRGRLDRRGLMRRAWAVARAGAAKFGGTVRAYIAEAVRQTWAEVKARLAVARGLAEDRRAMQGSTRFALTLTGLFALQNAAGGGQLELALEGRG